jgi:LEA14-like dessication related protein
MKKGWLIALGLLLLGGTGAYVWYNRLITNAKSEGGPNDGTLRPRLEMSSVSIANVTDEQIDLSIKLLIDNPLPVTFKAKNLRYTVFMARVPLIEETYAKPIEIKPGDSTLVTLPMQLRGKKLIDLLKKLDRKNIDTTTYGIRAAFDLDVPILGQRTFTHTIEERGPTYYLPQIKIKNLDFGKLGLKRTDVAATVLFTNRNQFSYSITDTRYTVVIDGKEIADGHQPEPIVIKKDATTPIVFPVTVKAGQSLGLLPKVLFDKKDTPVLVTFRCTIPDRENNNMSFKDSKLNLTLRSTLAELTK